MKILILANNDVGLYKFRKKLIEKLLISNEVVVALPYGELIEPLINIGCKFVNIPIDRRGLNPIVDFRLLLKYISLLKAEAPSLVLTYTIKPNIYGGIACRFLNIPYSINITGLGTAFQKDGLIKKLVIRMYKIACKNAKVVFFENEENQKEFIEQKLIRADKTYCLNGAGVDLDEYKLCDYPYDDKIRFLFIGRVMAEKGVNELFEAINMLIDTGVNCELDVVGGYEEDYKSVIKKYERAGWLHYYGYQKDVKPFIENCHCFILPSWHEGMANTNLECAASGRPIITSNIAGCREAVINNISGFLFEKNNVNDLYKCLKEFSMLTNEKRKIMGIEGRKLMENKFDKRKIVYETMKKLKI